jgi:aminoglycoside phosphotransferase (APT) family kinase protein
MKPTPAERAASRRFAAAPALGDLPALLGGGAPDLLRRSGFPVAAADPTYVRFKAGTGALVGFTLIGLWADGTSMELPAYVRTFPDQRAAALAKKWESLRPVPSPVGGGVHLLAGGRSVLFVFPNDDRLRGLRFVSDMDKLKRVLPELPSAAGFPGARIAGRKSEMRPVRYKPERRFVAAVRFELRDDVTGQRGEVPAFVRFFPDGRGGRLAELAEALRSSAGPDLVPRPLGTGLHGRLMAEEAIAGEELYEVLLHGRIAPGLAESIAEALARLHRSGPPLTKRIEPLAALRDVAEGWETMWTFDVSLRSRGERVLGRLAGMLPSVSPHAPVHGDLHLHQIMVTSAGPVFVDLERGGLGDPAQDLAGIQAHVTMLAADRQAAHSTGFAEAVLDAYRRLTPATASDASPFFLGCALLNRALLSFRGLEADWNQRADVALSLAEEATRTSTGVAMTEPVASTARPPVFFRGSNPNGSHPRWEVFYPRRRGPWGGFLEDEFGSRTFGFYEPEADRFGPLAFGDDPALPRLRAWAETGELASYRPGRRATVRLADGRGTTMYAKLMPPRKAARLLGITRAAGALRGRGGQYFPAFAPVAGFSVEDGVVVFEEIPGPSLHELLMDPSRPRGERLRALEATARSVAAFHAVRAPELPERGPEVEPAEYAAIALRHFPERRAALQRALDDLVWSAPPGRPMDRPVHGDLHDRNILLRVERVALLDLDMLHAGDPVEDVGNLAGHLVLRALQRGEGPDAGRRDAVRFVDAYRRAGGSAAGGSVAAAGARTLFRLSCLYLFRRRWQGLTVRLLEEAVRWTKREMGEVA